MASEQVRDYPSNGGLWESGRPQHGRVAAATSCLLTAIIALCLRLLLLNQIKLSFHVSSNFRKAKQLTCDIYSRRRLL